MGEMRWMDGESGEKYQTGSSVFIFEICTNVVFPRLFRVFSKSRSDFHRIPSRLCGLTKHLNLTFDFFKSRSLWDCGQAIALATRVGKIKVGGTKSRGAGSRNIPRKI